MAEAEKGDFGRAIDHLKSQIRDDSTFTEAYIRLADFFRYHDALQNGETYFVEAIALNPENANLHLGRAVLAKFLGESQRAFEHSRLALELGATTPQAIALLVDAALQLNNLEAMQAVFQRLKKNPQQEPLSNLGLALWKFRTDNFDRAKSALHNYLNTKNDRFALKLLGDVYQQSNQLTEAISSYLNALRLTEDEASAQTISLLRSLGTAYLKNANGDSADYFLTRALLRARRFADLNEQLEIHTAFVHLNRNRQRYAYLLHDGAHAIQLAKRLQERQRLPALYFETGAAYEKMGDHQRAIKSYGQAAAVANQFGDELSAARGFNETGRLLTGLGRRQTAQEYLQRSIETAQSAGAEEIKHLALMNLADLHLSQGEEELAVEEYSRVLRYAQDANQRSLGQTCLLKLANLFLRAGNTSSAGHYLVLADAAAKQTLNLQNAAIIRALQGRLALAHQEIERAETYFLDAIQLGRETGSSVSRLAGNAGLISTYLAANFTDLAAARADTALKLLDEIGLLFFEDDHAKIFDLKNDLIAPALAAYSRMLQPQKVYEACETYKAYQHIQSLAPIRHLRASELPDSLRWKLDDLQSQIHRKWQEAWEVWRKDVYDDVDFVNHIKREIQETQEQLMRLRRKLAASHPEFYSLVQPTPAPIAALQGRLAQLNSVLVHYLVGESSTDIVVVRPDSTLFTRVNYGSAYLKNLIEQMNPIFAEADLLPSSGNGASEIKFRLDLAAQLYQIVFAPIKNWLPANSGVIIAPDDILNQAPWECLVSDDANLTGPFDYKNARFLMQDFAISYIPYANFLNWTYGRAAYKQKSLWAVSGPALASDGGNHQHGHDGAAQLFDQEARRLSSLVGNSDVFTTRSGAKMRFLSQASIYQFLHFAGGAVIEDGSPLYSKIYLWDSSSGRDSIECRDLFDVNLSADLMTMSAAQFLSDHVEDAGLGVSGLLHALNYAGAAAVVLNQWPGNRPQTSALFLNFYANLKEGLNTVEALRQAKLTALAEGNRNPVFWAGVVMYGVPRAIKFEGGGVSAIVALTIVGVLILGGMMLRHYYFHPVKKTPS
jgi:tetratricopeptide (TPR) repeat protein